MKHVEPGLSGCPRKQNKHYPFHTYPTTKYSHSPHASNKQHNAQRKKNNTMKRVTLNQQVVNTTALCLHNERAGEEYERNSENLLLEHDLLLAF